MHLITIISKYLDDWKILFPLHLSTVSFNGITRHLDIADLKNYMTQSAADFKVQICPLFTKIINVILTVNNINNSSNNIDIFLLGM